MRDVAGQLPLIVRKLRFSAGGRSLIDIEELEIASRVPTAVIGPNGAGKSLLVRLLHGLIPVGGGTIDWNGEAVGKATRLRQAMVFQKPVLLRRSVAANVDFVLSLKGRADPDVRDRFLEEAGLLSMARQPARSLSGGEQQRLALVRALACDPEVLFLDEPSASLDPASVLRIEELISTAAARGVKVILVTHDIGQARRVAGDVVFVHNGGIAEHTLAERFFDEPQSAPARAYLAGRIVL
jgi:tungstate transport system ATP-binding protein